MTETQAEYVVGSQAKMITTSYDYVRRLEKLTGDAARMECQRDEARQWAAYLYRELGKQGGLCARCGWPYTVHRAGPFTEHRCFRCAVERGEVERE